MHEIINEIGVFFADPIARGLTFIGGATGVSIWSIIWNNIKTTRMHDAIKNSMKSTEDIDLLKAEVLRMKKFAKAERSTATKAEALAIVESLELRIKQASSVVQIDKVKTNLYD